MINMGGHGTNEAIKEYISAIKDTYIDTAVLSNLLASKGKVPMKKRYHFEVLPTFIIGSYQKI